MIHNALQYVKLFKNVKALSQHEYVHDTIMTIYGARYQKKKD